MPRLRANGIDIEYETFGDPKAAPLLLVMGLGAQLIAWDESFCTQLAERGFHVIRYDNRDAGLSTKMEEAGEPDLLSAFAGSPQPAYALDDLADDAVGVLDALDIGAAHVVRDGVAPESEGAEVLASVPPETRDGRIEHGLWIRRLLSGPLNPFDEAGERARVARAVDRSWYPLGTGRQLVAVLAAQGRLQRLAHVRVPTLVVHGLDDPLVPVENGRRVAAAVPGARLLEFVGMGHNLPERYWPAVLDAIDETAHKANVLQTG